MAKTKRYRRKYGWYPKGLGTAVCVRCNKSFSKHTKTQKYCSLECANQKKYLSIPHYIKEANRKLDKTIGYIRVYCPEHPEANTWGYVYEHRVIAEQMAGRRLLKNEIVHHKNGIRSDNRQENLEIMDKLEHSKLK